MRTLGTKLNSLRCAGDSTCDLSLVVPQNSGQWPKHVVTIPVHALVLSVQSTVFKAMLKSQMKETVDREIHVFDSTPEAMRTVVSYLYIKHAKFDSIPHCVAVCTAAHKYALPGLITFCSKYMRKKIRTANYLTKDEIVMMLGRAELFDMKRLEKACFTFLLTHGKQIPGFPTFLTFSQARKFIVFQNEFVSEPVPPPLLSPPRSPPQHTVRRTKKSHKSYKSPNSSIHSK